MAIVLAVRPIRNAPIRVDGSVRFWNMEVASRFGIMIAKVKTVKKRINLPSLPLSTVNTDRVTTPPLKTFF